VPGFHYFPQLPLLVRIAIEAEGLARGTHVTLLPLHNPVELAEIGAFLDLITGGKFLLGVGSAIGRKNSPPWRGGRHGREAQPR
jgi:alkanesulfonate monooxygenase SsuD/methylene tetrahydromethanopterin reductase-like flavin-dependent oxidoreductase (luciferase family)